MELPREKIIIDEADEDRNYDSPIVSEEMSLPFDSLRITFDPKSKNKTKAQREFQELQRLLRSDDSSPITEGRRGSFDPSPRVDANTPRSKQPVDIDFLNVSSGFPQIETNNEPESPVVPKKDDLDTFMSQWEELSELFAYSEFDILKTLPRSFEKITKKNFQSYKKWTDMTDSGRLELVEDCIESVETNSRVHYLDSLKSLLYISLGCFGEMEVDSKKIQLYQMKENFKLLSSTSAFNLIVENSLFYLHSVLNGKCDDSVQEVIKINMNVLFIYLYHARDNMEDVDEMDELKKHLFLKSTPFISSLFDIIIKLTSDKNAQFLPLKKSLYVVFGPFMKEITFMNVRGQPKYSKQNDYKLKKDDVSIAFNSFDYNEKNQKLPAAIERDIIIKKSKPKMKLHEKIKIDSKKEIDPTKLEEMLYQMLYPRLPKIVLTLCKTIFAALPDSTYQGPISFETHINTKNEHDSNRHKQIILKTISEIILILNFNFRKNNILQSSYFNFLFYDVNGIIILLKYYSQDLDELLINKKQNDTRISLLNSKIVKDDNTPETRISTILINFMKILKNITKDCPIRINLLINENATKILKKCLKYDIPRLRYYTLKLIKSCIPSQTYKWRKGNMNVISMIYEYLPPDLFENFLVYTKISKKDMNTLENQLQGLIEEFNAKYQKKLEDDEDLKEQYKIYQKIILDDLFCKNYEIWLNQII